MGGGGVAGVQPNIIIGRQRATCYTEIPHAVLSFHKACLTNSSRHLPSVRSDLTVWDSEHLTVIFPRSKNSVVAGVCLFLFFFFCPFFFFFFPFFFFFSPHLFLFFPKETDGKINYYKFIRTDFNGRKITLI